MSTFITLFSTPSLKLKWIKSLNDLVCCGSVDQYLKSFKGYSFSKGDGCIFSKEKPHFMKKSLPDLPTLFLTLSKKSSTNFSKP